MIRWWILAVLAVLPGMAWQPASASPSPLPAPERAAAREPAQTAVVRVGTLNNATDAPFFLAGERGYLREEGLDLETTPFDSAQQMIAPLGVDQLDAGGGAVGAGLFNAVLRGIHVRIVADLARAAPGTRFNCLMVRKDLLDSGAVRTFADLRGRVYAEPIPGGVMRYVLERELRQAGVRPDEMRYVTIPFPQMMTAFSTGVIDAAFPAEPFKTLGAEQGIAECWQQTADLLPDYEISIVLYGPTFAQQRADIARRFMVAYLRGARDYYQAFFGDGQGRGEVLELLTRITPIRDRALLERIGPIWMDPNGGVNVASLRETQRWYVERADLPTEADLDRVVDPSFADAAVARLGRYPVP